MATLSSGGLGMGISFTLRDNYTKTAKRIQMAQDRLKLSTTQLGSTINNVMDKSTAKYMGFSNAVRSASVGIVMSLDRPKFNQFGRRIDLMVNKAKVKFGELRAYIRRTGSEINNVFNEVGAGKIGAGAFVGTLGFGGAIKAAAELSDQLANVQKTTGLTDGQLDDLYQTVKKFDTRTSIADLLEIGTVGGRLGVAQNEIQGFIKSIDMAVVALGDDFSGGAEQIATELGKIKGLFADTKNARFDVALTQIGSALNELGNSGANSAGNVANFTKRIGQLGKLAPNLAQTMGLGATLEEVGINAEIASGGLSRIMLVAGENAKTFAKHLGMTTKEFKNMLDTSPNDLIKTLAKSFTGVRNSAIIPTLKDLKIGTDESVKVISSLANNLGLLEKRQALAAKAMAEGVSLQNEFNIKNRTLQAEIDKAKKKFVILAQTVGIAIVPVFMALVKAGTAVIDVLSDFIQTPVGRVLTQLASILTLGALAWATYTLSIAPAIGLLGKAKTAILSTASSLGKLSIAAGAFTALVAIVYQGIEAFDRFNGEASKLSGASLLLTRIGGIARGIMEIVTSWDNVSETFLLSKGLATKLKNLGILDFVVTLGTWIVRIIEFAKGMFKGLVGGFTIVYQGIKLITTPLVWLGSLFLSLVGKIGKNTTAVRMWAAAGQVAGYIMTGVLLFVGKAFVMMGVRAMLSMGKILWGLARITIRLAITAGMWIAQFIRMGVTALISVMPALLSIIGTLAAIVVSVIATAVVWVAQFILMGITAIIAMSPFLILLVLIGAAIYAVIKVAQWLINKFTEIWAQSDGWIDFGKNMVKNIWEGVKSLWGQFTSWLSNAMSNIPMVGQFFGDEEMGDSQVTVRRETIGDSVARQQGFRAAPITRVNQEQPINTQDTRSINLFLDGEQIGSVIDDRNTLEQARE